MSFSYIQEVFAQNSDNTFVQTVQFPKDDDWVEFTYDKNKKALLTDK